jgi:hypothetical protein
MYPGWPIGICPRCHRRKPLHPSTGCCWGHQKRPDVPGLRGRLWTAAEVDRLRAVCREAARRGQGPGWVAARLTDMPGRSRTAIRSKVERRWWEAGRGWKRELLA